MTFENDLIPALAVETFLLMEDYGEYGTEQALKMIQTISEMAETERITKVGMLSYQYSDPKHNDIGKMVAIRDRTVSGTLTGALDLQRNNEWVIGIDNQLYKMEAYDLIIVNEPEEIPLEEQAISEGYHSGFHPGMDPVKEIQPLHAAGEGPCTMVRFQDGRTICSHENMREIGKDETIPSLRLPRDTRMVTDVEDIPNIISIRIVKDCTHVEFDNGAFVCSKDRHAGLGEIEPPSLITE